MLITAIGKKGEANHFWVQYHAPSGCIFLPLGKIVLAEGDEVIVLSGNTAGVTEAFPLRLTLLPESGVALGKGSQTIASIPLLLTPSQSLCLSRKGLLWALSLVNNELLIQWTPLGSNGPRGSRKISHPEHVVAFVFLESINTIHLLTGTFQVLAFSLHQIGEERIQLAKVNCLNAESLIGGSMDLQHDARLISFDPSASEACSLLTIKCTHFCTPWVLFYSSLSSSKLVLPTVLAKLNGSSIYDIAAYLSKLPENERKGKTCQSSS